MWLAHALTLSRLPIALALAWSYGDAAWSVLLVVLAAATDAADGNVARYMRRRGSTGPDIGGWLDPLVDKVFVVIVLATIWFHTHDLLLIALIAAREVALLPLTILCLVARRRPIRPLEASPLGKVATIGQFLALALAIARPQAALPAGAVAAGLGLAAVAQYIGRELRARRGRFPSTTI